MGNEVKSTLGEISARVAESTPGPWTVEPELVKPAGVLHVASGWRGVASECDAADAAFIAHAREDVPWLLARVELAEKRIALMREALNTIVTADVEQEEATGTAAEALYQDDLVLAGDKNG